MPVAVPLNDAVRGRHPVLGTTVYDVCGQVSSIKLGLEIVLRHPTLFSTVKVAA